MSSSVLPVKSYHTGESSAASEPAAVDQAAQQTNDNSTTPDYSDVEILPKKFLNRNPRYMWNFVTCVSYAEAHLSYRLYVRPSVTHWYCIKTAEHIVMLSTT